MSRQESVRGPILCLLIALIAASLACGGGGTDMAGRSPTELVQKRDTPVPTSTP